MSGINVKNAAAGGLFAAFGLVYGLNAILGPRGSGRTGEWSIYFPLGVSAVLVALGAILLFRGLLRARKGSGFGTIPWKALILVSISILLFAVFVEYVGMLPVVFVMTLVAFFAYDEGNIWTALAASAAIAIFSTAVFIYGIGIRLPVAAWNF